MEYRVVAPPTLQRTPGLLLGPFYPVLPDPAASARLWSSAALPPGARALRLDATLLNLRGEPVAGALVEVWHADHQGRYRHLSAADQAHVAPCFSGYGVTHSDARGTVGFDSIVPGPYSDGLAQRAPHIHFQVTGAIDRLVTQMFIGSDAATLDDRWYRTVAVPALLTPTVFADEPDRLHLHWTLVLTNG